MVEQVIKTSRGPDLYVNDESRADIVGQAVVSVSSWLRSNKGKLAKEIIHPAGEGAVILIANAIERRFLMGRRT